MPEFRGNHRVCADVESLKNPLPLVVLHTTDEDGSPRLLSHAAAMVIQAVAIVVLEADSMSARNLMRTRTCGLSLASERNAYAVKALIGAERAAPVECDAGRSAECRQMRDEPATASIGLAEPAPPRSETTELTDEFQIHLEAVLEESHSPEECDSLTRNHLHFFVLRIRRANVDPGLLIPGSRDQIDARLWDPLFANGADLFGLKRQDIARSMISTIAASLASHGFATHN